MPEPAPPNENNIFSKVFEFMKNGPPHVSNFRLIGEGDVPIVFRDFTFLFSSSSEPQAEMKIGAFSRARLTSQQIYGRVRGLTIPKRVTDLQKEDLPLIEQTSRQLVAGRGWPLMVIAFGNEQYGAAEAAVLFVINGISPQTALATMQDKAEERLLVLAKLNNFSKGTPARPRWFIKNYHNKTSPGGLNSLILGGQPL